VACERRQELVDVLAAVAWRHETEQPPRGFVEPDDRTAAGQHDDAIGKGGGALAERAQQADEAALAGTFGMQFFIHVRRNVGPHAAVFGWRPAAPRTQPRLDLVEA